ncbi:SRPBCC family protein [Chitinophaga lutea]
MKNGIKHRDYVSNMLVDAPPAAVYQKITRGIADWWSRDFRGQSAVVGDVFTVRFNRHHKTFRITAAVPGQLVEWTCEDALIDMPSLRNQREWINTKVSWNLEPAGDGTRLRFTHHGLSPSLECWEVCEPGWNEFLGSLHRLATAGKGTPFVPR